MISKNFFLSLQDIAHERQLNIEALLKKVEFAMGVACKKVEPPYTGDIKVEVDYEKFEFKVTEYKYVVEELDPENPVKGQITLEEAKEIALKHANLTNDQVIFGKCELDYDGTQKYDIEFHKNNVEYNYEIDANTGEIISYEQD